MLKSHEFEDQNWGHCLALTNDQVELMIPFEFGPRILRYAIPGGTNPFAEFPAQRANSDQTKWHSYGGHRLWHAPEDIRRSYLPDNTPVTLEYFDSTLLARQAIEPETHLQKEMEIHLDPDNAQARIIHRIRNHSLFEIRLSLWAITVMQPGGRALLPLPPRGSHDGNLQAQTSLNLWAYTDLTDPRWRFGKSCISFDQDPSNSTAQKIGISRHGGWLAYLNARQAFVKKCVFVENQPYPDQNSSLEIYADHKCVELESLSPLTSLQPGASAELIEDWLLIQNIEPASAEAQITQYLAPSVRQD